MFCGVSTLLLVLAALHTGWALHCFESACLGDLNVNNCLHSNRTVQKECNTAVLRQNLNKLIGAGGTNPLIPPGNFPWVCAKHVIKGTQPGGMPAEIDLKMCFPESQTACDQLKAVAKGLEFSVGQQVTTQCLTCTGDSCNPAHRPTASIAAAILAVVLAALVRC